MSALKRPLTDRFWRIALKRAPACDLSQGRAKTCEAAAEFLNPNIFKALADVSRLDVRLNVPAHQKQLYTRSIEDIEYP
jgi:hypothetical protein